VAKTELQTPQVKEDPFATREAKIKELRKQRDPKLGQIAVNRYDFIDALIAAFDENQVALGAATAARNRMAEELRQISEDRAQMFLDNQELEANMKMVHDRNVELVTENESLREQVASAVRQTLPSDTPVVLEEGGGDTVLRDS
jgi:chromosome segregation ATPase